ncbi:heterodisulfide reductase subunit F [candidate division TA06 bacterium DG_24]|jgi:sulfhydrogenase subunit gamma (sulfur reductase)|uniref:Heterodisulfide reductase subunit F n=3 Tax=Bacteria division TA06 TaxID=1156500 RepID=A0A0S8JLA8_UNCT6|nr:MAG: heterodisulfide reductase subunit F [candidate division TA06 bacterium DG_24]KPK69010.1 MAG: heterodisulfide reductase subunit F [candidate division TA06 bacterium SM23_40]KPL10543.1 MAG: heterodisulfide reductase subunit F [candidate division TA06 bacterium SM1_40]
MSHIYMPHQMEITEIIDETPDTRTLKLVFKDEGVRESFSFKAGQFGLFSVYGAGECTFDICSSPTWKDHIECCFRKVGKVTSALWRLEQGDLVGFRGPYGNWFPVDEFKGKNIVFIAGGIAFPPIRGVLWNCVDLRDQFKDITIVYGARTVSDLVYKYELEEWEKRDDVSLVKTVDPGGETPDWDGKIGFVPTVLEQAAPSSENAVALVCGPPIMIKFTLPVLTKLGFSDDRIYSTLENRMKCGVGKCGRCNIADVYVCKEGPVFTAEQMKVLPPEY